MDMNDGWFMGWFIVYDWVSHMIKIGCQYHSISTPDFRGSVPLVVQLLKKLPQLLLGKGIDPATPFLMVKSSYSIICSSYVHHMFIIFHHVLSHSHIAIFHSEIPSSQPFNNPPKRGRLRQSQRPWLVDHVAEATLRSLPRGFGCPGWCDPANSRWPFRPVPVAGIQDETGWNMENSMCGSRYL